MLSFWKFLNRWAWHEGPKTSTLQEFIRAAPSGQMMRYQQRQEPTVLHRWKTHVDGWTQRIPASLRHRVHAIRFEDLCGAYPGVMRSIAPILESEPTCLEAPSPHENVIQASAGIVGAHRDHLNREDRDWFAECVGTTMARLGYSLDAQPALAETPTEAPTQVPG